ncbi:hypothetical protein AB0M43_07095 [Longispora sp. NPDC051575]|uniref:hypothetical protein n=1 Tax=Longispora sp. NPDC051575 TaxID=3154943 RepID=UPI003437B0BA
MSSQTSQVQRVLSRTESWFIRQGIPQLITGYGFRQIVSRMVPYLVFTALLWLDMFTGFGPVQVLPVAAVGAAATWAWLTRLGTRPPPRLPTGTAIGVLLAHVLGPPVVAVGMAALGWLDFHLSVHGLVEVVLDDPDDLDPGRLLGIIAEVVGLWIAVDLVLVAVGYLVTSNGLVALSVRALGHAVTDLRHSARLQGRALPVLLFVTLFLFFTGELWQLCNRLPWVRIFVLVTVLAAISVLAVATRLRVELGRIERDMSPADILAACAGTPLARLAPRVASRAVGAALRPRQQANLLFALAIRQLIQGAVVGLGLYGLFTLLGWLVLYPSLARQWIGAPIEYSTVFPDQPAAMFRLAVLLAGFGGMYYVVHSMNNADTREEFFAPTIAELESVLAVHAAYDALDPQTPDRPAPDSRP